MRVIHVYFLDQFPHMPVYEMKNGEIRLPFVNSKTGLTWYMTEAEFTKGVSDHNRLMDMRKPFTQAKEEISKLKTEHVYGFGPKPIAVSTPTITR